MSKLISSIAFGESRDSVSLFMLVLLAAVISVFLFQRVQPLPTAADTLGYVYAGERLANGKGPTYDDSNNQLIAPYFSMFAFQIRRPGDARMFLGFPPGFPLLLALGAVISGNAATMKFVVPLLAIVGIFMTFHLGRLVSGKGWIGLWAAILLVTTPIYWRFGTTSWSEIPAMVFTITGVNLYLLSRQPGRRQSHVAWLSLMAGGLLVFGFFIRYANVVILPAIGLHELATSRKRLMIKRLRWLFFVVVAVGIIGMLLFNEIYYGGVTITSYSPVHGWYPQPAFSIRYALGPSFVNGYSLIEIGKTLWQNFPVIILLWPVGLFFMKRSSAILVVLAAADTLALYSVYAFAATGVNSRFIIPALPFIVLAIAFSLTSFASVLPNARWRWLIGVVVVFVLFRPVPSILQEIERRNERAMQYIDHVQGITAGSEPDAVFLSYTYNDMITVYGKRSVLNYRRIPPSDPVAGTYHWELLEPCLVQILDKLLAQQTPIYYVKGESPPFADSFAKLQRHFQLDLMQEAPEVYRISHYSQVGGRSGLAPCE